MYFNNNKTNKKNKNKTSYAECWNGKNTYVSNVWSVHRNKKGRILTALSWRLKNIFLKGKSSMTNMWGGGDNNHRPIREISKYEKILFNLSYVQLNKSVHTTGSSMTSSVCVCMCERVCACARMCVSGYTHSQSGHMVTILTPLPKRCTRTGAY